MRCDPPLIASNNSNLLVCFSFFLLRHSSFVCAHRWCSSIFLFLFGLSCVSRSVDCCLSCVTAGRTLLCVFQFVRFVVVDTALILFLFFLLFFFVFFVASDFVDHPAVLFAVLLVVVVVV